MDNTGVAFFPLEMTTAAQTPIREAPHGHAHGAATSRALWMALALTTGFAVVEAVGGWLAGSLALISDAGHMVTDAASFVIALIATRGDLHRNARPMAMRGRRCWRRSSTRLRCWR
jgi:Co/Zn/Cd efflux system component